MLRCPVCGSDKILGKEDAFYCYDYEYDKLKLVNGQLIPHRTFHMLHGPFEDLGLVGRQDLKMTVRRILESLR